MMKVGDEWITIVPPGRWNPLRYIPESLTQFGFSQTNFMMVAEFSGSAIQSDLSSEDPKRKKIAKDYKLQKMLGNKVQARKTRFILQCMLLDDYKSLGFGKHGAVLSNGIRVPFGLNLLKNSGLFQGNVDKKDLDLPHFWVE
jgi:hypothetical protein